MERQEHEHQQQINFERYGRFYNKFQRNAYLKIEYQQYRNENRKFIRNKNIKYNNRYETNIYHGTFWNDQYNCNSKNSSNNGSNSHLNVVALYPTCLTLTQIIETLPKR